MSKVGWFRSGLWNTAEHASTRILDAAATFFVLWAIPTEKFSVLALAQAWVAPALFFFIAPETILYRDFAKWEAEGRSVVLARVRFLRRFAWSKAFVGAALSLVIAAIPSAWSSADVPFSDRFFAMLWAFALPFAPQIAGPDREFLRIDLKLRELNFVTFFQRALYLTLLSIAIYGFGGSFALIAASAGVSVFLAALISRHFVEKIFRGVSPSVDPRETFVGTVSRSLADFSIWNHLAGIVIGWMQTMDLFFLGVFRFSAIEIGLYSTILKLANFTLAAPFALANLYAVHLGRSRPDAKRALEWRRMLRLSVAFGAFVAIQAIVFRILSPWILSALSRGRWSTADIDRMIGWFDWILPACAVFGSLLLWTSWLNVRTSIRTLVLRAYLPWGVVALSTYGLMISRYGSDGAAKANLIVVSALIPLLFFAARRSRT